jgi:hypothetical protein
LMKLEREWGILRVSSESLDFILLLVEGHWRVLSMGSNGPQKQYTTF